MIGCAREYQMVCADNTHVQAHLTDSRCHANHISFLATITASSPAIKLFAQRDVNTCMIQRKCLRGHDV